MASENIVILSDADFEEKVLKSEQPILVDFIRRRHRGPLPSSSIAGASAASTR